MDPVGRVTGQRQPSIHIAVSDHRRQRVAPSAAHRADRPEMWPQPPAGLPPETHVVQCHERHGVLRALGPDDRRDIRGTARFRVGAWPHRQRGKRSSGQEMLQRDIVMRPLMRHRTDDRRLAIRNSGDLYARLISQRRVATLCRDDQLALDQLPLSPDESTHRHATARQPLLPVRTSATGPAPEIGHSGLSGATALPPSSRMGGDRHRPHGGRNADAAERAGGRRVHH